MSETEIVTAYNLDIVSVRIEPPDEDTGPHVGVFTTGRFTETKFHFWLQPREAVALALRLLNCAEEATRDPDAEADR